MVSPARRCATCNEPLVHSAAVTTERASRRLRVTVDQSTVPTCVNGHLDLMGPVVAGEVVDDLLSGLVRAHVRWWSRRRACGACGAALTMPSRRTARTLTTRERSLPLVTATFELAVARCTSCGSDNALERRRSSYAGLLRDALVGDADASAGPPISDGR